MLSGVELLIVVCVILYLVGSFLDKEKIVRMEVFVAGCAVIFVLFGVYAIIQSFTHNSTSSTSASPGSNPNAGYMTMQDDNLVATIALKKSMGQSVTADEQRVLDMATSGKLGKPYEDRPKKD